MARLTEDALRSIIRKAIMESTNMGALYHFTDMQGLLGMAKSGKVNLSNGQQEMSGGKNFLSFTRHKSHREGYAAAEGMELPVRVEFDMARVNSMHGVKTEPFEYYSPARTKPTENGEYYDEHAGYNPRRTDTESAKEMYRREYKIYHDDPESEYDEPEHEYMNQAEERLASDNGFISTAAISRVDVACYDPYGDDEDNGYEEDYYDGEDYGEELDEAFEQSGNNYMIGEIIEYAEKIMQTRGAKIPFDRIFFYDNEADFIRQTDNCLTLPQFVQRMSGGNRMQVAESVLSGIISKAVREALNEEGIHIKKKNRGKFNATKERTGKSTEELTRSKDPLTRKRAIFAQNAKKWNKKK